MGAGKFEVCRADGKLKQAGILCWSLKEELFLPQETSVLFLRYSTCWMRPIHILESNLLYLKSIDYKSQLYLKNKKKPTSQQHLDWHLTKQLYIITQLSCHIKLTITESKQTLLIIYAKIYARVLFFRMRIIRKVILYY